MPFVQLPARDAQFKTKSKNYALLVCVVDNVVQLYADGETYFAGTRS